MLYQLHPILFDIFVEGEFDQDFIDQFVGKLGKETEIAVFPINTVNIPDDTLIDLGLPVGSEKSRVTALAILLEQNFGNRPSNIVCLVDADHDRILQKVRNEFNIRYTDFTCMEMYLLDLTTLKKFFTFTCNMDALRVADFMRLASLILPCQFVARAVVEKMGLSIAILYFKSGLKKKGKFDSFDQNKYFDCFLSNAVCRSRREEIIQEITRLMSLLDSNLKHKSHGHDFIDLMFEYLWSEGGVKLHNKGDEVQKFGGRLIATAVDFERLSKETFFSQISNAVLGLAFMCSDSFEGNGELLKQV
jgi:hypothetical protein